jgi:hypothetical protein
MARKRRMRKTGEWARIFGKQNAQPAPEPVIVAEAIIEEPVIAEPIIAEPVAEAKMVLSKLKSQNQKEEVGLKR